MKKSFLILSLFLISFFSFSQGWVDIGVKGNWGPTFLNNKNIWSDNSYNHSITTKGGFGAKVGLNFNENHQITFDFMLGGVSQDFKYNITDTLSTPGNYTANIQYQSFDYYLMYRNNNNGKYFEVGPLMSQVRSIGRTDEILSANADPNFNLDQINKTQAGLALGFGAYIMGTDNFGVTMGFRGGYMFSDLINSQGKTNGYPTLVTDAGSSKTSPLFFQLIFEANFDFAYLARANCGKTKLLMF